MFSFGCPPRDTYQIDTRALHRAAEFGLIKASWKNEGKEVKERRSLGFKRGI